MAVWIYGDESESDSGPRVFTLAGFNAAPEGWKYFMAAWLDMLRTCGPYPVPAYHAVDVRHAQEPFDGWTPEERQSLTDRAVAILCDRDVVKNFYCAACSIVVDDFTAVKRPSTYDLYLMCAESFFWQILSFAPHCGADFIFDKKEKIQTRVTDRFLDIQKNLSMEHVGLLRGVTFQDDRLAMPLQAADLLAYEVRSYIRAHRKYPTVEPHGAYKQLKETFLRAQDSQQPPYRKRNFRCFDSRVATQLIEKYPDGKWPRGVLDELEVPED